MPPATKAARSLAACLKVFGSSMAPAGRGAWTPDARRQKALGTTCGRLRNLAASERVSQTLADRWRDCNVEPSFARMKALVVYLLRGVREYAQIGGCWATTSTPCLFCEHRVGYQAWSQSPRFFITLSTDLSTRFVENFSGPERPRRQIGEEGSALCRHRACPI